MELKAKCLVSLFALYDLVKWGGDDMKKVLQKVLGQRAVYKGLRAVLS